MGSTPMVFVNPIQINHTKWLFRPALQRAISFQTISQAAAIIIAGKNQEGIEAIAVSIFLVYNISLLIQNCCIN
jgi:hypothetical protein